MDCKEAVGLVNGYIRDELPPKQMEEFIGHVRNCPSCYDELETYYIIMSSLSYLDEDQGSSYNIKDRLLEDMKEKMARIHRKKRQRVLNRLLIFFSEVILVLLLFIRLHPELAQQVADHLLKTFFP